MRKVIAFLLVLTMLLPYTVFAKETGEPVRQISTAEYAAIDEMWTELNGVEARELKGRADRTTAMAVASAVEENEMYLDGTLRWNGEDHFTFETTVGVTCGYSTRLRNIAINAQQDTAVKDEPLVQTISYAEPNVPGGKDVYLIEPYYQIDMDFTEQYQKEAQKIAKATGGTYHLYMKTAATIDAIADAMESGAVVIFDSHGDTDFARGDDYTTGATTSYLLLQTGSGLTNEDYANDNGTYHAVNYGGYGAMRYYAVDGTCIANHMEKSAPNSLLWMAICLGMATDGLQAPLHAKGVEVVYGYSQSVTFDYDYLWEECFWNEMRAGKTVAEAIATMKEEVGLWDYCDYYTSIQLAKKYDCAFPIVVSTEDTYPGHGNVDALQTVYSSWRLCGCAHEQTQKEGTEPTCTDQGYSKITCMTCGEVLEDKLLEALGHDYVLETVAPTCMEGGCDVYTCSRCGESYTENETEALGHAFENCACVRCDAVCVCAQFTDVNNQIWHHKYVVFAVENGLMNGVGGGKFNPDGSVTRAMLVTILYRNAGSPSTEGLENPFTDLKQGAWYYNAVLWAANEGIVTGVSAASYAPDKAITREQIATILYRHCGQPEVTEEELEFPDASDVSGYALSAMRWAISCGLINGVDGKLAPTATATRAQLAAMLMRYLEN